jgi:hypothetical protein
MGLGILDANVGSIDLKVAEKLVEGPECKTKIERIN